MQNHNDDTIKTSGHSSFEKYTSHFIERVVCERELETEQNCNRLTPTLMAITAILSRSPGMLNWRPGSPASLGAGSFYSISFPTRLISNCSTGDPEGPPLLGVGFLYRILSPTDWTSCAPSYIIVQCPPSCGRHKLHSILPVHGRDYILIFVDRMYLLFTEVHFLFWQLGRVGGQYATLVYYCW